ncbi:MAG: MFS transporter [bacterium]
MTLPASWRTPLIILIAGTAVSAICVGMRNTFGLFLSPMTETYGWSIEEFSLAIAVQNIVWGISAPITGGLADRFGTSRVITFGGLVYGLGLYMMSLSETPSELMFSAGLLIGLGTSATGFGVVFGAVGRVTTERNRTLYLGIASAGGSMGQFMLVPLGQVFISSFGWVAALMALGVVALFTIPLGTLLAGKAGEATSEDQATGPINALGMAGRQPRYWLLFWGFFVCGFHITFIATHLPKYLKDINFDPIVAAWALGTIGLFNVIGSLVWGNLGGRYSKRKLLAILYSARSVIIAVFMMLPISITTVLFFAAGMGFTWLGTVPLTSALVGQMYGVRYMNTLFSGVFLGHQIGAFLGVWGGGYIRDLTGSYDLIWYAGIALGVISSLLHLPIDERANEAYLNGAPGRPLAGDST